jgi:protein phosphatase
MGGHVNGATASKTAVDSFDATFNSYVAGSVSTKLGAALHQANHDLANTVKTSPGLDGMGCTLVGAYIDSQGLQWVSVGDSPMFLWRRNKLLRLNADHSMTAVIEESRLSGKITAEEAASHPGRHELRSALTGEALSLIDAPTAPLPLYENDVVILASDGLLTLSEKDIAYVLRRNVGATADTIARQLLLSVEQKKKPRQDNTTIQVVVLPVSLGEARTRLRPIVWALIAVTLATCVGFFAIFFGHWTISPQQLLSGKKKDRIVAPQPVRVPQDVPVPVAHKALPLVNPEPIPVTSRKVNSSKVKESEKHVGKGDSPHTDSRAKDSGTPTDSDSDLDRDQQSRSSPPPPLKPEPIHGVPSVGVNSKAPAKPVPSPVTHGANLQPQSPSEATKDTPTPARAEDGGASVSADSSPK